MLTFFEQLKLGISYVTLYQEESTNLSAVTLADIYRGGLRIPLDRTNHQGEYAQKGVPDFWQWAQSGKSIQSGKAFGNEKSLGNYHCNFGQSGVAFHPDWGHHCDPGPLAASRVDRAPAARGESA
jgi:hypothetical protein